MNGQVIKLYCRKLKQSANLAKLQFGGKRKFRSFYSLAKFWSMLSLLMTSSTLQFVTSSVVLLPVAKILSSVFWVFTIFIHFKKLLFIKIYKHKCYFIYELIKFIGSMTLVPYLHSHQTLYPLYVELLLSLSPSLLRILVLDERAVPNLVMV